MTTSKEIRPKTFMAEIEAQGHNESWPLIRIPFDVEKTWGTRARLSVKGMIGGVDFQSSIFPSGDGSHHMMVNRAMREAAKVGIGDRVKIVMEPDLEPRPVELPPDFAKALGAAPGARAAFDRMPPSHRKRHVDVINEAKKPETRASRIEKAVTMILRGDGPF